MAAKSPWPGADRLLSLTRYRLVYQAAALVGVVFAVKMGLHAWDGSSSP